MVRAGVALLDEKVPEWHGRIDVGTLDIAHWKRCILGQLTGDFNSDEAAALDGGYPAEHGFLGDPVTLNRLWSYVVKQRQAVAA